MENKFGLKPFDKVLVRDSKKYKWGIDFYERYSEEEGGYNGCFYVCLSTSYKYCIPYEGNEHLLGTTDDYVEPWQPKGGDFVVLGRITGTVCIYKEGGENPIETYAAYNLRTGHLHGDYDLDDFVSDNLRPATDTEKQQLLDALHEIGKDWDAEKKEIVEHKQEPKIGKEYWTVYFDNDKWEFDTSFRHWCDTAKNNFQLKHKLVFYEFTEAKKKAEKMNELLKTCNEK